MKLKITQITAIIMALLVLFSTVTFTVEKHFCGDSLIDTSYFGASEGCAGEFSKKTCDMPSVITKESCCKNKIEKVQGQEDLQKETYKNLVLEKQAFILAFVASYNNLFLHLEQNIAFHKHYSSPLFNKSIQILYQVFIL